MPKEQININITQIMHVEEMFLFCFEYKVELSQVRKKVYFCCFEINKIKLG